MNAHLALLDVMVAANYFVLYDVLVRQASSGHENVGRKAWFRRIRFYFVLGLLFLVLLVCGKASAQSSCTYTFVPAGNWNRYYLGGFNTLPGGVFAVTSVPGMTVGYNSSSCGGILSGSPTAAYVLVQQGPGCTVSVAGAATPPVSVATVVASFTNNSANPVSFAIVGPNGESLPATGVLSVGQVLSLTNVPDGCVLGFVPTVPANLVTNGGSIFDATLNADSYIYTNTGMLSIGSGVTTNTAWGFTGSSVPFAASMGNGGVVSPVLQALAAGAGSSGGGGGFSTNVYSYGGGTNGGSVGYYITNYLDLGLNTNGFVGAADSNALVAGVFASVSNIDNTVLMTWSNNAAVESAMTNHADLGVTNLAQMGLWQITNDLSVGRDAAHNTVVIDLQPNHYAWFMNICTMMRRLVTWAVTVWAFWVVYESALMTFRGIFWTAATEAPKVEVMAEDWWSPLLSVGLSVVFGVFFGIVMNYCFGIYHRFSPAAFGFPFDFSTSVAADAVPNLSSGIGGAPVYTPDTPGFSGVGMAVWLLDLMLPVGFMFNVLSTIVGFRLFLFGWEYWLSNIKTFSGGTTPTTIWLIIQRAVGGVFTKGVARPVIFGPN